MPKLTLKVKKPFKWAHRHVDVVEYAKGDFIETEDEDLIRVATEEGWAEKTKESPPDPTSTQIAALKQEIADLDAAYGKAKQEDRPSLLEKLNAKRAELTTLEG